MIKVCSAPEYVLFCVCFVFTASYPTIELEMCTLGNRVKCAWFQASAVK